MVKTESTIGLIQLASGQNFTALPTQVPSEPNNNTVEVTELPNITTTVTQSSTTASSAIGPIFIPKILGLVGQECKGKILTNH